MHQMKINQKKVVQLASIKVLTKQSYKYSLLLSSNFLETKFYF